MTTFRFKNLGLLLLFLSTLFAFSCKKAVAVAPPPPPPVAPPVPPPAPTITLRADPATRGPRSRSDIDVGGSQRRNCSN